MPVSKVLQKGVLQLELLARCLFCRYKGQTKRFRKILQRFPVEPNIAATFNSEQENGANETYVESYGPLPTGVLQVWI